jgi:hypothetical protein
MRPVSKSNPLVTFEEASREALRIGARMTLPERIRWLEEAEELGLRLQAWRWKAGQGVDPRLRPLFEARHGPSPAVAEEQGGYHPGQGGGVSDAGM